MTDFIASNAPTPARGIFLEPRMLPALNGRLGTLVNT
jgi:hypothetical protein